MDRLAPIILTASVVGLAATAPTHGSILSLGDQIFAASLGEVLQWDRIDAGTKTRLASIDLVPTVFKGEVSIGIEPDSASLPEDSADFGSLALLPISGEEAAVGDFSDLISPSSSTGSFGGTTLASQSDGAKGMPSTSESESGGFAPPDWSLTEDGRNLSVGPQTESNGTTGTDLTPVSVPGSGIAALGPLMIAGRRRRH
ncbi:MAG: hypothetical protein ACO38P_13035 [Phycisphaerales bacterium]